ncbi:MAG: hypothetical protein C1O27_002597 [Chloroflexi bacterium]|jgi:hypothetical protein|nr:MAG: hypothetical protein C1O27_002597 [Chloroflexota bacterium]
MIHKGGLLSGLPPNARLFQRKLLLVPYMIPTMDDPGLPKFVDSLWFDAVA